MATDATNSTPLLLIRDPQYMGRKRKPNPPQRGQASRGKSGAPSARPTAKDKAADVQHAIARAASTGNVRTALADEGLTRDADFPEVPVVSGTVTADQLLVAFDALTEQTEEYRRCADAAAERGRVADQRAEELATKLGAVAEQREQAGAASDAANKRLADVEAKAAELAEREDAVATRERAAEAGFAEAAKAAHEQLTKELADRRLAADKELADARAALTAEHRDTEERLEHERAELDERERFLASLQRTARTTQIELDARAADLDAEITARAAADIAAVDREMHTVRVRAEESEKLVNELTAKLTEYERERLRLGHIEAGHLLTELEAVRAANVDLHNKLAERLDDDNLSRLRALETRNRELEARREQLEYEVAELRGKVLANRINNLEIEQLRDLEKHFELVKRGYEERIAELSGTIEDIFRDRPKPGTALFPRCVAMDDEEALGDSGYVESEPPDLSQLAREMQAVIFTDRERAYRLNDLCVLLGGLAMTRLHLLEGMSGTGKTSLPLAVASALGTHCVVVEVQAGWRDRADLFGNHNTFEHRFEESDFLQALYLAQTPRYRDRPFFIVLDEMNLSRPEQYFSVILSKLENSDSDPIQLVTTDGGNGRTPRNLVDGTSIHLPDNVWFVGTANQDESTLEFADKTYNRAHVMELPAHRPFVRRSRIERIEPYDVKALRDAFKAAQREHNEKTKGAYTFVQEMADPLFEHGRVQVAPRIVKQFNKFVPVVVAAWEGARPDEKHKYDDLTQDGLSLAVDHFFATKVLSRLRNRYDVTEERVAALRTSIEERWEKNGFAGTAVRCIGVLDDVARRWAG
ncbi:MAG TPA: hypothetical protein VFX16_22385 [Pseudonocardiaceae bacterium]|nr:hypothetical protein [Pseudonocardiaceae bacterium]